MSTYNIYINNRYVASVDTEEAAWEVIGSHPFGCCFTVTNAEGVIRSEFIVF